MTDFLVPCPECGALFAAGDGPVHEYVPSSPGCWAFFAQVQADEMMRFGYPPSHRMVVDAYAAQDPGDGRDRRARQSVVLHQVGLCATIEHGADAKTATNALRQSLQGRPDFPRLERSGGPGSITIVSMRGAADLTDYTRRARAWAIAVWASWSNHHEQIRQLLPITLNVNTEADAILSAPLQTSGFGGRLVWTFAQGGIRIASASREHSDRFIVITRIGHRDRSAATLGSSLLGGGFLLATGRTF